MALNKITDTQMSAYGVVSAPDVLKGTAAENKALFDRLIRSVVAVQFNELVDKLTANTGAAEIGSSGGTVQADLATLAAGVKSITVEPATKNIIVTMYDGTKQQYNVATESGGAVAEKSTTVEATLLASGWAEGEYTLIVDGVTADSYQEVLPALGISEEQLAALQGANIQDAGQREDAMVLKAYGEVPTIDLPIRVVLRGD